MSVDLTSDLGYLLQLLRHARGQLEYHNREINHHQAKCCVYEEVIAEICKARSVREADGLDDIEGEA